MNFLNILYNIQEPSIMQKKKRELIAAICIVMVFWREILASCTFDQPTGPIDRSNPYYYHTVPSGTYQDDYVTATVQSNNGCNQSSLIGKALHEPNNHCQNLWDCYACMIHKWNAYTWSNSSNSKVSVKVSYDSNCVAVSDDIFLVLAIQDKSGNTLWSNYILLFKPGYYPTDSDDQVETRKTGFCSNYSGTLTVTEQESDMEFTFSASADKQFQLKYFLEVFWFCQAKSGTYSVEMISPTPIAQVSEIQGTAPFTFDPTTLILTASASIEQMDSTGADGYDGTIDFILWYDTPHLAGANFSIDYKNCNKRLYWLANPVVDPQSASPNAGESLPFFDLVVSDGVSTTFTLNWYEDSDVCGGTYVSYPSITAEVSSDVSHIDGSVYRMLTFNDRAAVPATYMQRVTIVVEIYFLSRPDTKITTTFVVKEHDCRPQNTPPTFNMIGANSIAATSLTHTDFQVDLGIDATMCNLGTDTFELSGPATGDAYIFVTDPSIAGWSGSSTNDLIITVTDPSTVDFDGKYTIRHTNGQCEETTQVVICYIMAPNRIFSLAQQYPFKLVMQSLASFTAILEPYTPTQEPECLNVVYSADALVAPPTHNPFTAGHATVSANSIIFTDFYDYTEGTLPIEVKICYDCSVSAAYTINFDLQVIDCEQEAMTVVDPGNCPLTVTFPVFYEVYRWDQFMFDIEPLCIVDRYQVTIRDPHELATVYYYEYDGTAWSIAQPSSDIGSLGEKFITDHENNLLVIDSLQFRNPLVNNYYGDYQIEVQGGVGTNSPAAYFDPQMISCTLSIVCVVQSLDAGEQDFESSTLFLGDQLVYDVQNYTQFPDCGYNVDYTLTLIGRNSTQDQPVFQSALEGWNTHPPFIHLNQETEHIRLRIAPEYGFLLGESYAVYINGNVNVNRTVQGPIKAHNEYFDVTIPALDVNYFQNQPPLIPLYEDTLSIYQLGTNPEHDAKYKDSIYVLGLPVDRQFDKIYVSEWGMLGWSEEDGPAPSWIQFVNETDSNMSEDGVRFKLTPSIEQVRQSFKLYFNLTDTNANDPMTQVYELTIHVLEALNFDYTDEKDSLKDGRKALKVGIEPYESEVWTFKIFFSDFIYVPANFTDWSNENEGNEKIQLEFRPNEDTQQYLEDTDTKIDVISWRFLVADAQDDSDEAQGSSDRSLQAHSEHVQKSYETDKVVEIDEVKVQISLTQRERVSYSNKDTVMIKLMAAQILSHDIRYNFSCLNTAQTEDTKQETNSNIQSCEVSEEFGILNNLVYLLKLDRYQDQDEQSLLAEIEEVTLRTLIFWFSANFVMSIFSSGFLQFLWSMINTLQIVMLTSLFSLEFPDNATVIMTMIMKMCSADLADTESLFKAVFGFRDTATFQSNINVDGEEQSVYAIAGYDSSIFFMLLGPLLPMILLYVIVVLLKKLLQLATIKCSENFFTRHLRKKSQVMSVILRFMLESCIEVGLSAIICIFMIDGETFKDAWESISTVCAFLSLVALLFAPFVLIRLTRKYLKDIQLTDKLDDKNVKNAKLFKAYRVNQMSLLYSTIFFLRRYLMLFILTLLPTFGLTQVFLQMGSTMFVVAYLGRVMPFQSPAFSVIEILNELMVLGAAYPLLTFTDWVLSLERRNQNGWSLVAYICINVIFNITIAISFMARRVQLRCKYYFTRKRKIALYLKQQEKKKKHNELILSLFSKPREHNIMEGREPNSPSIQAKPRRNGQLKIKPQKFKGLRSKRKMVRVKTKSSIKKKEEFHEPGSPVFNPDSKLKTNHRVAQKARSPQQPLKEWPGRVHEIDEELKVEDVDAAGSPWQVQMLQEAKTQQKHQLQKCPLSNKEMNQFQQAISKPWNVPVSFTPKHVLK